MDQRPQHFRSVRPDQCHGRPLEYGEELTSQHPGGVNALFGDGSVHFLKNSMNPVPLAALCTRSLGEIIDDFILLRFQAIYIFSPNEKESSDEPFFSFAGILVSITSPPPRPIRSRRLTTSPCRPAATSITPARPGILSVVATVSITVMIRRMANGPVGPSPTAPTRQRPATPTSIVPLPDPGRAARAITQSPTLSAQHRPIPSVEFIRESCRRHESGIDRRDKHDLPVPFDEERRSVRQEVRNG